MRAKRTTIGQERLQELMRKERYHDLVLTSSSSYSTSEVAALVDKSAIWLNKFLEEKGVIKKTGDLWSLTKKYVGKGLVVSPTLAYSDHTGEIKTKICTRWTEEGRRFIWELLNEEEEEER